jgi:hypothetical protein
MRLTEKHIACCAPNDAESAAGPLVRMRRSVWQAPAPRRTKDPSRGSTPRRQSACPCRPPHRQLWPPVRGRCGRSPRGVDVKNTAGRSRIGQLPAGQAPVQQGSHCRAGKFDEPHRLPGRSGLILVASFICHVRRMTACADQITGHSPSVAIFVLLPRRRVCIPGSLWPDKIAAAQAMSGVEVAAGGPPGNLDTVSIRARLWCGTLRPCVACTGRGCVTHRPRWRRRDA